MGRARRQKENKSGLKIWLPIICIIIVAITFFMIHDIQTKIKQQQNQNVINQVENTQVIKNETIDENVVEENKIEDSENEISTNSIQNTSTSNTNMISNNTSKNTTNQSNGAGITDKKQKAIDLVKKEWGEDNTVDYVFDYVNENGEYVIAVKDRASATVKYYFRVNLETETVELD